MQVVYADERHLAASVFFDEEVPPVERSNVRGTDSITVEVLKKVVKSLERKGCYVSADGCSEVNVVLSEGVLVVFVE